MANERLGKLDIIRFPLIVGIAFIHSYHPSLENTGQLATFIRLFINNGVFSVCVPMFFFISGYLFFHNKEWSWGFYKKQLNTRLYTIVMPYILWTVYYWVLMYVVNRSADITLPQFWYLNELIALALISPVFHWIHKRFTYLALLGFVIIWLFFDWHFNFPVFSSMMPTLFFYAGSVFAVKNIKLSFNQWWAIPASLVMFAFPSVILLHNLGIIFGVVSVITLANWIYKTKVGSLLSRLSGSTFFVFAFHAPLVQLLFSSLYERYHPASDLGIMALWFVSPVLILIISVFLYRLLNTSYPKFTAIITGSRNLIE